MKFSVAGGGKNVVGIGRTIVPALRERRDGEESGGGDEESAFHKMTPLLGAGGPTQGLPLRITWLGMCFQR